MKSFRKDERSFGNTNIGGLIEGLSERDLFTFDMHITECSTIDRPTPIAYID